MHANGAPHTPFATRLRSGGGGPCEGPYPAGGSPCRVGPKSFPARTEEAHAV